MKKLVFKFYPAAINMYTIWILYIMFFAYSRGSIEAEQYSVQPFPFESISHFIAATNSTTAILKNLLGNIILFIPYGFLGIIYPKLNQYKYLFITFYLAINYLEFSQYFFKRGFAEFDDVMLNTIGMSIGFLVYKKFRTLK